MRWMRNTILIVVCLGLLTILFKSADVNYGSSGAKLAGFAVIAPNFPSGCDEESLKSFWNNSFNASYRSNVLRLVIANDSSANVDNTCKNFAVYNISKDNYLVYAVQNSSSFDGLAFETTIFATINLSKPITLPSNDGALVSNLTLLTNSFNILGDNRSTPIKDAGDATLVFNNSFMFKPQSLQYYPSIKAYNYSDVNTSAEWVNITKNFVGNATEYSFAYYGIIEVLQFSGISFTNIIPNLQTSEDTPLVGVINLKNHFSSTTPIEYGYNINASNSVLFDDSNETNVTIDLEEDWNGVVGVSINGSYQDTVYATSNVFVINVTPVNDPPKLYDEIEDFKWSGVSRTVNLDDYFVETEGEEMVFYADEVDHMEVIFSDNDHDVKFRQESGWTGSVEMIIYANDSQDQTTASNEFNLTVIPADDDGNEPPPVNNSRPIISSKSPSSSSVTLVFGRSQTFSVTASDPDNDTLTYTWSVNNIDQTETSRSYTFAANSEGSYIILVEIDDGVDTLSNSWSVVVNAASGGSNNGTSGSSETRGSSQIIQKPKGSLNIALIIIIIVAALTIAATLIYKFVINKTPVTKTTIEVKSTDEKPGIEADQESDFYKELGKSSFFDQMKEKRLKPILDFVKKYHSLGATKEQIKEVLLKKGWKEESVDEALSKSGD